MEAVYDTGSETGNGSIRGTGNGLGIGAEAVYWADCWLAAEGGAGSAAGAESTSVTEAEDQAGAVDVAGRRHHLHLPGIPVKTGLAWGERGRTSAGSVVEEEWMEGGRRGEETSESKQSCGC